jgi:uncharacterized beta-barrel protein YwiB (DUF1934 family)
MKGTLIRSLLALLLATCLITSFACGPSAKFELGALNISPAEVVEGSSVAVSVDVTNAGQAEGNFEAKLKIDNTLAETKKVSIAAGETTTVSFTVDANAAGIHDVKLNNIVGQFSVLTPPQFANLVISPTQVKASEAATISADITNVGEIPGNYTVTLKIDGVDEETKVMTIGAGETKTASFIVTKSTSGTYNISLGSLSGDLTVLKPAGFLMSNLVISPTQAVAGREVSIMCDVSNTGEVDGTCTVNMGVDGILVDSKQVAVAAGATQTVAFSLVKDIGGTYSIAIGTLSGTLVVSEGVLPTLHVGDQWVFRGIYSGVAYTITETVAGEEFIQGKDCYVKEVTYDPSISGISKATYWIEKATLDILRSQYSFEYSGVAVTCSTVYDPKYPGRGPWPKTVGSEWNETGTITETCVVPGNSNTDTESYSMNYKVEKVEDITVGAGTFRCLKIVVYENGVATQNHWYSDKAKTFVKIAYLTDQDGEQLLSYSVK